MPRGAVPSMAIPKVTPTQAELDSLLEIKPTKQGAAEEASVQQAE